MESFIANTRDYLTRKHPAAQKSKTKKVLEKIDWE
jgi:hypothetical protein